MDKFLETQYLPRLSQEEVEKFNRPITINELQSVIKKKKGKTPNKQKPRTRELHRWVLTNIQRRVNS